MYNLKMAQMLNWLDPKLLNDYRSAPSGRGIYVIGKPIDPHKPVTACTDYDDYIGRWPDNMRGIYVGISESKGAGVRGRLSCHARGKGNKCVADHIRLGSTLYFITISGYMADFESLILCLKNHCQFECNVRDELERGAKRRLDRERASMSQQERDHHDNLDMGEHGEGM